MVFRVPVKVMFHVLDDIVLKDSYVVVPVPPTLCVIHTQGVEELMFDCSWLQAAPAPSAKGHCIASVDFMLITNARTTIMIILS